MQIYRHEYTILVHLLKMVGADSQILSRNIWIKLSAKYLEKSPENIFRAFFLDYDFKV